MLAVKMSSRPVGNDDEDIDSSNSEGLDLDCGTSDELFHNSGNGENDGEDKEFDFGPCDRDNERDDPGFDNF
jgi:hypothetical protein